MGQRSSITRLDPAIRAEVDLAIKRGLTIDGILAHIKALGADVSRSAVGRYSKDYAAFAARQRDMRSVAEAFGREFGEGDNAEGKLLLQMLTSVGARMVMPLAQGDEPDMDVAEFELFSRAVKNLTSAAKTDADRDEKIARAAAEKAKRMAADVAETSARNAGASEETIRRVKADILGITL